MSWTEVRARIRRVAFTALVVTACVPGLGWAQDDTELAKKTQNPVADLISVPFQNNVNFGVGPDDDVQYILNIQPVIPFKLTEDWNLISRTIVPLIYQPELAPGVGEVFGLGDIQQSLFLSPGKPGKLIWGVGPILQFPTATDDSLGQGKWGAGPTAVARRCTGRGCSAPSSTTSGRSPGTAIAGREPDADPAVRQLQPARRVVRDHGADHHGQLGSGERRPVDGAHRRRRGQDRTDRQAAREPPGQRLLQRGAPGQRGRMAAAGPDPALVPAVTTRWTESGSFGGCAADAEL